MSSQTNKELWKRWIEVWNGNLSIADEIIAPNFVAHFAPASTSPAEVRGPNGLKQWIGGSAAAFTDYSFTTTVGPLADEDKVAGRWLFRGTYQGGHARRFACCRWETGRVRGHGPLSRRSWENRRILAVCRHSAIAATCR